MESTSYKIINAGDMSGSLTSIGINLDRMETGSITAVFTGSPVGTFLLQVSDDIVSEGTGSDPASNVVNWTDYSGTSQAISAAGDFGWNLNGLGFRWVRLKYTRTSGTGVLNAVYFGKW